MKTTLKTTEMMKTTTKNKTNKHTYTNNKNYKTTTPKTMATTTSIGETD
jgi:hypothetical protein